MRMRRSSRIRMRTSQRAQPVTTSCFALVTFLIVLCLHHVQAAPVRSSPPIKSIDGVQAFDKAIGSDRFSFVKFFHPSCPHCQAMAKDFDELAHKLFAYNSKPDTPKNHTITVLQVDASNKNNRAVLMTHAQSFPTLKLFRNGHLIIEYDGPRETKPMYEFLMRSLQLADRPLVTHLETVAQLKDFLEVAADRPVVISLFKPKGGGLEGETSTSATDHYPSHVHISLNEWEETVKTMHEHTSPQTVFATVPYPDLLVPASSRDRFESVSSRHSVPPLLAAVPRADEFETYVAWYFPGVRDGEPASSFMHTAVLGPEEFFTLDTHTSPHVLDTQHPLFIAFGKEKSAEYMEEYHLQKAARQNSYPKLVPVYADMKISQDLAEHVGLNVSSEPMNDKELESWKTHYVTYRFGNRGPVTNVYSTTSGKSVKDWIKLQAKALNQTIVKTTAGEVLQLDLKSWENLFEYDGRGVILELYQSDCTTCSNLEQTSERVAKQLKPYAGSIIVARFDTSSFEIPSWPTLPNDTNVPEILWVAPGETPAVYDGYRSTRGVARFAMEMSGLQGEKSDWVDVFISFMFGWGVFLTCAGLSLIALSRSRSHKREHVT